MPTARLSAGPEARYDHRLMATIRVALAEDNVLLREGVSRLVSANEEFELVGTAPDLPLLLALVREQQPDVVVTDIRMPPTGTNEGIQAAAWLRENHPEVGVVVLSQYTAPAYAMALLERREIPGSRQEFFEGCDRETRLRTPIFGQCGEAPHVNFWTQ